MSEDDSIRKLSASRRSFLLSSGSAASAMWLAASWPAIVQAADHARRTAESEPETFAFLQPAEVGDVDAITAQIVPSGKTPGAREAHVTHFIDHALAGFLSWRAGHFRSGLAQFQSACRRAHPHQDSFAQLSCDAQIGYLRTVEQTEFFQTTRLLTLLGMFSAPQYGGNFDTMGWKMIGFVDQHAFVPPFGYYDTQYTGFVPYSADKRP